MYNAQNDYGCTKHAGCSDMTGETPLLNQLHQAFIEYERTELRMGTLTAEPASIVTYFSKKSNQPMTVLIVPQAGADSWAEDYYYFPGMTHAAANELDWYTVYNHVHDVSWQTITTQIPHPTPCKNCGKLDINNTDRYTDIRGRVRCNFCHAIRE